MSWLQLTILGETNQLHAWRVLEGSTAVIVACVPSLHPLIKRVFSRRGHGGGNGFPARSLRLRFYSAARSSIGRRSQNRKGELPTVEPTAEKRVALTQVDEIRGPSEEPDSPLRFVCNGRKDSTSSTKFALQKSLNAEWHMVAAGKLREVPLLYQ